MIQINTHIVVMVLDSIPVDIIFYPGIGKNVIIFGVDLSQSMHICNKGKDILILGKGPTQG